MSKPVLTLLKDEKNDCKIWMVPNFFSKQEADDYLKLFQNLPFNEEPGMFGRPCLRKTISFGQYDDDEETPVTYAYFKKVDVANPWTEETRAIRDKVWKFYKRYQSVRAAKLSHSNYCLINWYPNKQSGIGWHADDEKCIIKHTPIPSVSFGAARTFAIRRKGETEPCDKWILPHGSLVVMDGKTQDYYQHSILKTGGEQGVRINLTFRTIENK